MQYSKLMLQMGQTSARRAPSHSFAAPDIPKPPTNPEINHTLPSTTTPEPLDQKKYDTSIMWTEAHYDSDSDNRKNLSQKVTTYDYLRTEDGSVVADEKEIREMCKYFFSLCCHLEDAKMLLGGWSKVRPEPAKYMYDTLAAQFRVFRYANMTWKLRHFCTRVFPDYNRNTDEGFEKSVARAAKHKAKESDEKPPKKARVKKASAEGNMLSDGYGPLDTGSSTTSASTTTTPPPEPPVNTHPPAPKPSVNTHPPPPPPPPSDATSASITFEKEALADASAPNEIETEELDTSGAGTGSPPIKRATRSKKGSLFINFTSTIFPFKVFIDLYFRAAIAIPKPSTEIVHSDIVPPTCSHGDNITMVPHP
ncbi:hypothetical protein BJ165DRAFT_1409907 [Panaeolus papilionaceus]|nr:hypothetical protein BJ165DRAFT_1409907 [Panaeolus papilionaceus]